MYVCIYTKFSVRIIYDIKESRQSIMIYVVVGNRIEL